MTAGHGGLALLKLWPGIVPPLLLQSSQIVLDPYLQGLAVSKLAPGLEDSTGDRQTA